ncbi:MAG: hypothetical protein E2O39_05860 [Planctomycetota bacterium]|nr:MAG: hypothetical protein E2O39_05860 [Planctomycetota bacterium]
MQPRFGAIGKHGSITVVERFIRSMKPECTRRIIVPSRLDEIRRELSSCSTCYKEHRPHMGLGGRTPAEMYDGLPSASEGPRIEPRARWPRKVENRTGRIGIRLELVLSHRDGRRHLPIVELKAA